MEQLFGDAEHSVEKLLTKKHSRNMMDCESESTQDEDSLDISKEEKTTEKK
eukprot:gene12022-5421_t